MKIIFSHRGSQWFPLLSEGLLHLLLGLCLYDVEASGGKQVIDRKVGDSVELSSNLPTEGVSSAKWRYGNSVVAVQGSGVTANNPFQGRVEFDDVSFSLTVRELTLQDSGDFRFLSEANGQQRPTVIITLQVHEPISTKPKLVYNISETDLTGSCTVSLECRPAPHRNTNYILTVGNQTHEGPKLHYHITPQDGDTTVTCTASNAVSEMSASETLRCRNTDSLSNKDVEASGGKQVIDRKVGDSVELSSNLPTEGVSGARWRYGNSVVAVKGSGVTANNPFQGRVEFNDVSFSLTVRKLTLQDSGDFRFLSEANGQQRPTVIITLQVHEPISTKPKLVYNISEPDLNGSCTVSLECRAAPHRNTNYILTVGNQPHEGPKLHYHITPQDGDTTVTCTASNVVSEMSASETLRCRNTDSLSNKDPGSSTIIMWFRLFFGVLVILFLVWLLHFTNSKEVCFKLKHPAAVDQDESQQHPHSSPAADDASEYEPMRGSTDAEQGEPSVEYVLPQQASIKDQDNVYENQ